MIRRHLLLTALLGLLLAGCNAGKPDTSGGPVDPPPTGDFELLPGGENRVLVEGDADGLAVPLRLSRQNGHSAAVQLSINAIDGVDDPFLETSFSQTLLTPENDVAQVFLRLGIADLPLFPQQRQYLLTASDGIDSDQAIISVDVRPVDAPDVYLLIGQSNMVGFSGEGTRQAYEGGPDAPNLRILQLNVTSNDMVATFTRQRDFVSIEKNVVSPAVVTAQDPLHIPLTADNTTGKDHEYVGLGLTFAKTALNFTTRDVVLVPAAWGGSAFCINEDGPDGQWNATDTANPNLGNTWLFDRAVQRTNIALNETGGVLRGILWHQGESDSNERCAPAYRDNLERLIHRLRQNINADRRGGGLRHANSNIPFVIGTMSKGVDDREDLSVFSAPKQLVDDAHRSLPNSVPHVGLSNHDDLVPANGYPCGNTSCIHFGASALREMGVRYHAALRRAATQAPLE